ncbi:30S ribosomal protein S7 [bacterium]
MSRKKKRVERELKLDFKFHSLLISQYINRIMWDGKKKTAMHGVYAALDIVKDKLKDDPLKVLKKATENVKPSVKVKSRRIGGATYQVPVEVELVHANSLAIRWIIGFARARKGKPFAECLASEIIDAFKNEGSAVKKKEDTHKMAEANRAFAHYKW